MNPTKTRKYRLSLGLTLPAVLIAEPSAARCTVAVRAIVRNGQPEITDITLP